MTQQINLFDPRLRPRTELATARNLGISTAILLVLITAFATYTRLKADRLSAELAAVQAEVRTGQEQLTALAKAASERRVTPALADELLNTRKLLVARQEVMDVLTSGQIGNAEGFSGLMFGFARQAQADVWLTGFSITGGGDEIEIRGRLLDPAKLPSYVQRLSSEPVFHGRRFATLDMRSVEPEAPKADAAAPVIARPLLPSATPAASANLPAISVTPPRYVEFALRSANAANSAPKDAGAVAGGAQ
jgi:hypothetical protein